MAIQTYCDRDDIASIISELGVIASIDDSMDGVESVNDELQVTKAIERAALKINQHVRQQYKLLDVANNTWLTYANAVLAAYDLRKRRGNPVEGSINDEYQEVQTVLNDVRWGRQQLPDQAPSFDYTPTTSSMQTQLGNVLSPVVVNPAQSTGLPPVGNVRRITGGGYWNFWN